MANPSISIPDVLLTEVDDRRHSTTYRSQWICGAIRKRLELEDSGQWTEPAGHCDEDAEE